MNKISICGVAVISNLTVCYVCVFHSAVFGEVKLLLCCGFLCDWVMQIFCGVVVFRAPPSPPPYECGDDIKIAYRLNVAAPQMRAQSQCLSAFLYLSLRYI